MAQNMQSGYSTILTLPLAVADTTMTVATVPTVTSGRVYLVSGTTRERIKFAGVSGSTLTGLTRGLSSTADPSTGGTGTAWIAGTRVTLVAMHDQITDKTADNSFSGTQTLTDLAFTGTTTGGLKVKSLTTAQRDAIASPANGMIIYNTTTGEGNIYQGGAWSALASGSTQSDASTTVAGKVEVATGAELTAGTATGGTGASLVGTPATLSAQIQNGSRLYAEDAGANDTYVITLVPAITVYTTGMQILFKANTVNTGACTLNVNGLGAKSIITKDGNNLNNGVIIAGGRFAVVYDGTSFILESGYQIASDAQVVTGTDTSRVLTVAQAKTYYGSSITATTTRNCNSTGTQTVTHNLGTIPKSIEISCYALETVAIHSHGYYDSSGTQRSAGWYYSGGVPVPFGTTSAAYLFAGGYIGTIGNLTTTAFDIVWTGTGAAVTAQIVFMVRS